jgi:hypothetical protein
VIRGWRSRGRVVEALAEQMAGGRRYDTLDESLPMQKRSCRMSFRSEEVLATKTQSTNSLY